MKKLNKGFTLVELIIVIAILAIIMLIAIPNFSGIQQRMQVRADKATAAQIGKAVRVWFTDYTTDATLAAATADGSVLPSALSFPGDTTEGASFSAVDYSTLKGINSYITPGSRATSLKDDGKVYADGGKDGGYYGVFMTADPSSSASKIVIAIVKSDATVSTISGITSETEGSNTTYEVEVNYSGNASGVAYVEP